MPAVELFAVTYAEGKFGADYPFTSAFYESAAYSKYKKHHFDDLLPKTMGDAAGPDGAPQRSLLLWDARSISV